METSRANNLSVLVQQTERTIKKYIKDCCNVHLATVTVMEDISYQLWVESNSAFLEENLERSFVEEDPWQWDEECFFNSPICRSSIKKQRLSFSNRGRSTRSSARTPNSSSSTPSDGQTRTKRSTGRHYKTRTTSNKCDLDKSNVIRDLDKDGYDSEDEWVVIDVNDVLPNDRDWLVLSQKKNHNTGSLLDHECTEYIYRNDIIRDISERIDERVFDNAGTDEADSYEDWAILSMEIVERSLSDVSGDSTRTTPDSGIQSSRNSVGTSSGMSSDYQCVNRHCEVTRRKLHFS